MAGIPHDHYEPGSKGEKWFCLLYTSDAADE